MSSSPDLERAANAWRDCASCLDEEKREVNRWIIEQLSLRAGDRILELACGTAGLGLEIARRLAPTGSVLCSDISRPMVEAARKRADALGIANADFRTLDAQELDLDDDAFDGLVCCAGYMLVADPSAALREARRVLRTGRRLTLSVWAEPEHNPWRTIPASMLGMSTAGAAGTPGLFALADPQLLRTLLRGAGFDRIRVDRLAVPQRHASVQDWWETSCRLSGQLQRSLAQLASGRREYVEAQVLARADRYATTSGTVVMPAQMLVAAATRGPR